MIYSAINYNCIICVQHSNKNPRMSIRLNSEWFQTVQQKDVNGTRYVVVHPKHNAIVLFSKIDSTPLACLHFVPENKYNSQTVIAQRPDSTDDFQKFQGMINKDGQVFQLVISNLNDDGLINFNIIKDPQYNVNEKDPGAQWGLNQVNELHAFQSYAIQCDQSNNRKMILNSVKNGTLTIKQDENNASKGEKALGTQFYLSVVPQQDKSELVKRFGSTTWKSVQYFVIQEKLPDMMEEDMMYEMSGTFSSHSEAQRYNGLDMLYPLSGTQSRGSRESAPNSRGIMSFGPPTLMRQHSGSLEGNYVAKTLGGPTLMRQQSESLDTRELDLLSDSISKGRTKEMGVAIENLTGENIMNSKAATINYGEQIQVSSGTTNVDYDYEKNSVKCMIGLSVETSLTFTPWVKSQAESEEMLNEFVLKKLDVYSNIKPYKEENCVICLDNQPDTILFSCAHQCLCTECSKAGKLSKCPVCRGFISASIKASDLGRSN